MRRGPAVRIVSLRRTKVLTPVPQVRSATARGSPPTRISVLHRVCAIVRDDQEVGRLRDAFGPRLLLCDSCSEVKQALRLAPVQLIVISPLYRENRSLAPEVKELRAEGNTLIAVYADCRPGSVREVLLLGRAGADRLVLRDIDDSPHDLRRLAVQSDMSGVVQEISATAAPLLGERLFHVVQRVLEDIQGPPTAEDVARDLGVQRRTLTNWASAAGFRGALALIMRCRVLVAIGLLLRGSPSEQVALRLGYSSAAHLSNTMYRYAGCRLQGLRAQGSVEYWCRQLFTANRLQTQVEVSRARRVRVPRSAAGLRTE